MWRVYIAGQIYPLTPLYGSNWCHKIAEEVLGKPYVESLYSRSGQIYPDAPYGSNLGLKTSRFGSFAFYLLCYCFYMENLERKSNFPDPPVGVTLGS